MRQRWMQVAMAMAVVAGMGGHDALGAVCFPYAGGVPGATGSGPPDWWSGGATMTGSATHTWLEDPRWRGAFSDMAGHEKFQVVVENTGGVQYLVMSWEVHSDATGAGDKLYFGVWDDASSTGNIFRLTRNAGAETSEAGVVLDGGGGSMADGAQIWAGSGTLGSVAWTAAAAGSAMPAWMLNYTRVDVDCISPTICDTWAIRLRAKIDPAANTADATPSGIKISTGTPRSFRFWYEAQDNIVSATTTYTFPPPPTITTHPNESGPTFPDPNTWKQAQLGNSASCDGDIKFGSGDVYVNAPGSTQLDLASNTFHATPHNNVPGSTPPGISTSELTARFRIANWGSASFNSPEWMQTCVAAGSGPLVGYPDAFDLSCTWTGFNSCPYQPAGSSCDGGAGTKDPHQCVLVDLGLASGSTKHYSFAAQSLFQNMNFDVNSTLVRHATIDLRGLGQMPNGAANRDVYLYIHTRNLPEKIENEAPTDSTDRRILSPRQRFKDLQLPATGAIGTKDSARIQTALRAGKLTVGQVEQIMPTYIVYVWYDTGRTLATAAGARTILEALPSFGLFLAHDGDLDGWNHQLAVAGGVQVGPNLYKISAPNESTFPVTITIEPTQRIHVPWWLWILLGLVLVFIMYLAFRKKK